MNTVWLEIYEQFYFRGITLRILKEKIAALWQLEL